jgi:hypothetical protein
MYLSCLERRLKRSFSLRCDTSKMSTLSTLPVYQCCVSRHSVIPYHDSLGCPLDSGVEVGSECDVVVEEVLVGLGFGSIDGKLSDVTYQDEVAFFFLESYDVASDY